MSLNNLTELEIAQKLLKECYDLFCIIPEQENFDLESQIDGIKKDLWRYFK